jgi:putative component of membrane protein insertase Oxa1/YidC/SpoIIIJ protein YidD
LYSLISIVVFLIFSKKIFITLIQLYQHYASESTRRQCTLMPSCSEYALLALSKYNTFKALYKIYIRLTRKCKGNYQIDYP